MFIFYITLKGSTAPSLETLTLTLDESGILFIVQSFLNTERRLNFPGCLKTFWNPHFYSLLPYPKSDAFSIDVINQ